MHIAKEMEIPVEQRVDLFYAELLKDAGCTAYTSQLAGFWMPDELAAKRDLYFFRNAQNPIDVFSWLRQHVAQGASFPTRATHILDFLVKGRGGGMKEGFESTCHVAKRIAQRLGMSQAV